VAIESCACLENAMTPPAEDTPNEQPAKSPEIV